MRDLVPARRVTFLFDVDNTLIDNDRAKQVLSLQIGEVLGESGERRFWELYEEVRRELGLVNIPFLLARYGQELELEPELTEAERRRLRFSTTGCYRICRWSKSRIIGGTPFEWSYWWSSRRRCPSSSGTSRSRC